jgi:hypothetical protein
MIGVDVGIDVGLGVGGEVAMAAAVEVAEVAVLVGAARVNWPTDAVAAEVLSGLAWLAVAVDGVCGDGDAAITTTNARTAAVTPHLTRFPHVG